MVRSLRALFAALLTLCVALPAGANEPTVPTFRTEANWFQCAGGDHMKVQNLEYPVAWSTQAPTRSVQSGAGCGFADPAPLVNTAPDGGPADFSTVGQFTGNLRNMTVELHLLGTGPYLELLGTANMRLWVTIGGKDIFPDGTTFDDVPVETSSTGASKKLEFTIAGLPANLAQELGDGTIKRAVTVTVGSVYVDEVAYAWVWGTTEVPAGITFNDPTPSFTVLRP